MRASWARRKLAYCSSWGRDFWGIERTLGLAGRLGRKIVSMVYSRGIWANLRILFTVSMFKKTDSTRELTQSQDDLLCRLSFLVENGLFSWLM